LNLLKAEVEQVDTEDLDSDGVHGGRIELLHKTIKKAPPVCTSGAFLIVCIKTLYRPPLSGIM